MRARLLLTLAGLLLASSASLLGQEVYGMTAISITATEADTYHDTELDYAAAYYYDAARTDGYLYQNGSVAVSYGVVDSPVADFYLYTAAAPGVVYEGITNHFVRCYYYEEVDSTVIYEDPYGFSFLGSGDYGGNNGFVPPDEFATITVRDYYLGSTYVSETAPLPQQPASLTLTRGSLLNFTASGSPGGGTYSYTSALQAGTTIATCCTASTSGDPNNVQLQDPPNPNGVPTPGGLATITADYTSPAGSTAQDSFQVPTFGMSCYMIADEHDYRKPQGGCYDVTIRDYPGCNPCTGWTTDPPGPNGTVIKGTFCKSFIYEVHLQGSGMAADGRKLHYAGNNHFETVCNFTTADGKTLVVGRTVARDRCLVDGTAADPHRPGYCLPPQTQKTIELDKIGTVTANDTGDKSRIHGYRLDLFKGTGAAACNAYPNPIVVAACSPGDANCPALNIQ